MPDSAALRSEGLIGARESALVEGLGWAPAKRGLARDEKRQERAQDCVRLRLGLR